MDRVDRLSDYDAFAWVYNKEWGPKHSGLFFSIVESLALRELRAGAHILDLCCGTGHVAAMLAERGYRVTGVDASEEMLRFARQNAPTAEFVLDDARRFKRPEAFDAVVSTFDSLNHVMRSEELAAVFRNVHASLRAGGVFLFDLNTERNYKEQWRGSFGIVDDDYACIVRSDYCAADRTATFHATIFIKGDAWSRSDVALAQRWHPDEEVRVALAAAGFERVDACQHSPSRGVETLTPAATRAFYLCCKGRTPRET